MEQVAHVVATMMWLLPVILGVRDAIYEPFCTLQDHDLVLQTDLLVNAFEVALNMTLSVQQSCSLRILSHCMVAGTQLLRRMLMPTPLWRSASNLATNLDWVYNGIMPKRDAFRVLVSTFSGQHEIMKIHGLMQKATSDIEHGIFLVANDSECVQYNFSPPDSTIFCAIASSLRNLTKQLSSIWKECDQAPASSSGVVAWLYSRVVDRSVGLLMELSVVICKIQEYYSQESAELCSVKALGSLVHALHDRWSYNFTRGIGFARLVIQSPAYHAQLVDNDLQRLRTHYRLVMTELGLQRNGRYKPVVKPCMNMIDALQYCTPAS